MDKAARTTTKLNAFAAGCVLALVFAACANEPVLMETTQPNVVVEQAATGYIVQSSSAEAAAEAVQAVGGEVTHQLGIIRAVGATLLPTQVEMLKRRSDVRRVFEDATVTTSSLCNVSAVGTVFDGGKFD
ncbi:MAG: hypothetical protein OER22_06435, partial [Gammaproteobacteria bacterium]|nr:hypothetical protein [Gammaproteobacteria bacterium]